LNVNAAYKAPFRKADKQIARSSLSRALEGRSRHAPQLIRAVSVDNPEVSL
jgi:hypothetical protein